MICLVMCSSTYDYDSRLKITLSENIHIIQTEMIHAGTTLFWFALILRALLLLATSFRKLASYRDRVYMIIYVAVSHVAPSLRHGSAGRSSALGVMRSGWGWAFNCKEIMQSYINQPMSKMSWGFEMSWTRIRPGSRDIREVRKRQHFEWRKGRRSLLCAINIICCIIVSQNIIYLKTFCIITTFIYIMFFCYTWYYEIIISYQYIWDMLMLYISYCALLHWNAYHSCCAVPPSYFCTAAMIQHLIPFKSRCQTRFCPGQRLRFFSMKTGHSMVAFRRASVHRCGLDAAKQMRSFKVFQIPHAQSAFFFVWAVCEHMRQQTVCHETSLCHHLARMFQRERHMECFHLGSFLQAMCRGMQSNACFLGIGLRRYSYNKCVNHRL